MKGLRARIAALELRRGGSFFGMSDEQLEDAYAATLDGLVWSGIVVPAYWRPGPHADLRRTIQELEQLCEAEA